METRVKSITHNDQQEERKGTSRAVSMKMVQKFGPNLYLYSPEDPELSQYYTYFVVKSYNPGQEASIDIEGRDGLGGFISFLKGSKEENNISGQILSGEYPAGDYPIMLDACFYPEKGISMTSGFGQWTMLNFAWDWNYNEPTISTGNGTLIITPTTLGSSVINSNLKKLGLLDDLQVSGQTTLTTVWADTYQNLPSLPADVRPMTLDTNYNRVGINNSNPSYTLDVTGNANISDSLNTPMITCNNMICFDTLSTTNLTASTISATNYLNLPPSPPPDLSPITLDSANSFVGINQPNPSHTLDVGGDLEVSGTSNLGVTSASSINCLGTMTANTVSASNYINLPPPTADSLLPLTLNKTENKVGINTTIPMEALDVVGNFKLTGSATISGNLNTFETITAKTINAQNYINIPPGDITPITLDKANSRVGINNGSPTVALDVTGDALVSGNLTCPGTNTIGSVVSNSITAGTISATTYLNLPPSPPPDLDPLTLDSANNRVGINTQSPEFDLDVNGSFNVTGNSLLNGITATSITASGTIVADSVEAQTTIQTPEIDVSGTAYANQIQVQGEIITTGNGDPDGAIPAPVGSLYMRKDGGDNTSLYSKMSGGTTSTGWKPVGAGGGGGGGTVLRAYNTSTFNPQQGVWLPIVSLSLPTSGLWRLHITVLLWKYATTTASMLGESPPSDTSTDLSIGKIFMAMGGGDYDNSTQSHTVYVQITGANVYKIWSRGMSLQYGGSVYPGWAQICAEKVG